MKLLPLYKILTYILLPVAALLSLFFLASLLVGLSQPSMLLISFILGSVCLYIFTTFSFLNKGILLEKKCKHSLKDWIKVNAIVTIIFTGIALFDTTMLLLKPEELRAIIAQMFQQQKGILPAGVTIDYLMHAIKIVYLCIGCIALVLIMHLFITFKMLKQYAASFQE